MELQQMEAAKISILESRLDTAEKVVSGYQSQISATNREVEKLKGQKVVYAVIAFSAVLTLFISYLLILTSTGAVQTASRAERAHLKELITDIKNDKKLDNDYHHRELDEHIGQGFHYQAAMKATELEQRVKVIESDTDDNSGQIKTMLSDISILSNTSNTNTSRIDESQKQTDDKLSQTVKMLNTRWQGMKTIQALIYRKAFDDKMPDEGFYPE